MTSGPIDRHPVPPPAPRRESPLVTTLLRPVAYVAGFVLLAMILYRGHA